MQKPDVESIDGLSPAISIEQKTTSRNPRSTVGTVTEIHDYLRLLFARIGVPYSPATGLPIESQTVSQMVDRIMAMPEGTRLYLLAPVIRGRKGEYRKDLAELLKRGFTRVKIDGETHDIDAAPALDKKRKHDIEVVVDRVVVSPSLATRLADSIETGLGLTDGLVVAEDADSGERTVFSAKFACPVSGFTIEEIEAPPLLLQQPLRRVSELRRPRHPPLFRRRPRGAGPAPQPDAGRRRSLGRLVLALLPADAGEHRRSLRRQHDRALERPAVKVRQAIVHGSGKERITFTYDDGIRQYSTTKPFEGVLPNLERRWRESDSAWLRDELGKFQSTAACESCDGHRLKPEALCVKVGDLHIGAVTRFSIADAARWFAALDDALTPKQREIARRILKEINERLQFLVDVGLEYLTLSRTAGTLSGGESQRIRLASQIGSGLTGVLYVLDEALHRPAPARQRAPAWHAQEPARSRQHRARGRARRGRDQERGLRRGHGAGRGRPRRRDRGRRRAGGHHRERGQPHRAVPERRRGDPGAHDHAARQGGPAGHRAGRAREQPRVHRRDLPPRHLHLRHRRLGQRQVHPRGDTLYRAAARRMFAARVQPGAHDGIDGLEFLDKVVDIDQSPIGRTPRSNPATYTGAFGADPRVVRRAAGGQGAGLQAGALFLQREGRALRSLPGRRPHQDRDALPAGHLRAVRGVQGPALQPRNSGDSLPRPVHRRCAGDDRGRWCGLLQGGAGDPQQAGDLAAGRPRLHPGGPAGDHAFRREAQRVKLAKELSRRATGRTLYILDEPTTGLHFHDVRSCSRCCTRWWRAATPWWSSSTNLEVIKTADWIVDLGPEGGGRRRRVVADGTPDEVAAVAESYTGQFLRRALGPALARREHHEAGRTRRTRRRKVA